MLIKTYIYSEVRKLLRDNKVKYTLRYGSIIIGRDQPFPWLVFNFEEDGFITVQKIPVGTDSYSFKPLNIYIFLGKLVRFNLITDKEVERLHIKGITPVTIPMKVSRKQVA